LDFNELSKTLKSYLELKITEHEIQNNISLILKNSFNFKVGAIDFGPEILEDENLKILIDSIK
jgi:hypothetical protein